MEWGAIPEILKGLMKPQFLEAGGAEDALGWTLACLRGAGRIWTPQFLSLLYYPFECLLIRIS